LKRVANKKKAEGSDDSIQSAAWMALGMLAFACIAGSIYQGCRLSQAGHSARGPIDVPKRVQFAPRVQEIPAAIKAKAESTPEQRQKDLDYMNNLQLPKRPKELFKERQTTKATTPRNLE
jgi:hypothetical protein